MDKGGPGSGKRGHKTSKDKKYDFRQTQMGHDENENKSYFRTKSEEYLKEFISNVKNIDESHSANLKSSKYSQNAVKWASEILKEK